jgi:hypothetical protein
MATKAETKYSSAANEMTLLNPWHHLPGKALTELLGTTVEPRFLIFRVRATHATQGDEAVSHEGRDDKSANFKNSLHFRLIYLQSFLRGHFPKFILTCSPTNFLLNGINLVLDELYKAEGGLSTRESTICESVRVTVFMKSALPFDARAKNGSRSHSSNGAKTSSEAGSAENRSKFPRRVTNS